MKRRFYPHTGASADYAGNVDTRRVHSSARGPLLYPNYPDNLRFHLDCKLARGDIIVAPDEPTRVVRLSHPPERVASHSLTLTVLVRGCRLTVSFREASLALCGHAVLVLALAGWQRRRRQAAAARRVSCGGRGRPNFARAVDTDDTRHALDEIARYDAFRDCFSVISALQSMMYAFPLSSPRFFLLAWAD